MPATAQLFLARAAALVSGTADVQMFPPGLQTIVPFKPADSKQKAEPMTLVIDERTATDLEAARSEYQAAADSGHGFLKTGDALVVVFEHKDGLGRGHVQQGMVVHGLVLGSESLNFSIARATCSAVSVLRIWSR